MTTLPVSEKIKQAQKEHQKKKTSKREKERGGCRFFLSLFSDLQGKMIWPSASPPPSTVSAGNKPSYQWCSGGIRAPGRRRCYVTFKLANNDVLIKVLLDSTKNWRMLGVDQQRFPLPNHALHPSTGLNHPRRRGEGCKQTNNARHEK